MRERRKTEEWNLHGYRKVWVYEVCESGCVWLEVCVRSKHSDYMCTTVYASSSLFVTIGLRHHIVEMWYHVISSELGKRNNLLRSHLSHVYMWVHTDLGCNQIRMQYLDWTDNTIKQIQIWIFIYFFFFWEALLESWFRRDVHIGTGVLCDTARKSRKQKVCIFMQAWASGTTKSMFINTNVNERESWCDAYVAYVLSALVTD